LQYGQHIIKGYLYLLTQSIRLVQLGL